MIVFSTESNDAADGYICRIACMCGHRFNDDEPLELDLSRAAVELGQTSNAHVEARIEAFRRAHPDGVTCPSCGEASEIGEHLASWMHPAVRVEAA